MLIELVSPFPEYALPVAWSWIEGVLPMLADDFALRNPEVLIEAARVIDEKGGKTWGVQRDGRLCGFLTFEPVNEVSGVGHCFFAPWALGRKTTDSAVRLALAAIFDLGYERVSCPVLADNWRVRALLKRVGIQQEGILRSFTKCGGKLADLVMAGITKADFYVTSNGIGRPAGRVDGRLEQHDGGADGDRVEHFIGHHEQCGHQFEHAGIQPDADGGPDGGGKQAHKRTQRRDRHDADGDGRHECDQPDVQGDRRSLTAKPRRPRVRKQRSLGHGGAAD